MVSCLLKQLESMDTTQSPYRKLRVLCRKIGIPPVKHLIVILRSASMFRDFWVGEKGSIYIDKMVPLIRHVAVICLYVFRWHIALDENTPEHSTIVPVICKSATEVKDDIEYFKGNVWRTAFVIPTIGNLKRGTVTFEKRLQNIIDMRNAKKDVFECCFINTSEQCTSYRKNISLE